MLQGIPSLMVASTAVVSANNVALVSGQSGGNLDNGNLSRIEFTFAGNVTNGNVILIGANCFNASRSNSYAIGNITKEGGTATIGTVVLDSFSNSTAGTEGVAIFRVPITGTGSLTLGFTPETGVNWYAQIGCAEFSGLNASPLDAGGTNSGTGTAHTTGSLTTSIPGVIYYSASELSSSDFTRTISDTTVRNDQSGATGFTGLIQFKLISSSPNTLTDTTGTDSSAWKVAYGKYKTS